MFNVVPGVTERGGEERGETTTRKAEGPRCRFANWLRHDTAAKCKSTDKDASHQASQEKNSNAREDAFMDAAPR